MSGNATQRPSWQAHALTLALRGYRIWSARQPDDLATQRRAQDNFGAGLKNATDVAVVPLTVAGRSAEWSIPPGAAAGCAVLYLHGGAYTTGSLASHRGLVTQLAAASGVRTLALAYRLAPEDPFPAALDDATGAYRWLLAQGFAPGHIALAGDSAGGGLAAATLVAASPPPAGAALLSPWADLTDTDGTWERRAGRDLLLRPAALHTAARHYLGDRPPNTALASPARANLHGLPPLLIQVGSEDLLLDDVRALTARARAAGVAVQYEEWPGMFHVWHVMATYLPEARAALIRVGTFLREQLAAAP